jgi:hypothetical protein
MLQGPKRIYILVFIFGILPWLIASLFAWPQTDDYAYAAGVRGMNYTEASKAIYLQWSGRYSANAFLLAGVFVMGDNFSIYKWVNLLFLLFSFSLILLVLKRIFHQRAGIFSLAVFIGIIALLPDTAEALFWLPGIAVYTLGAVALFALFSFYGAAHPLRYFFLPLLVFLANGFSEVIWISVALCIVYMLYVQLWDKRSPLPTVFVLLTAGAYVLGLLSSAFAPGNFERATVSAMNERFEMQHVLPIFTLSLKQFASHILQWISKPLFLFGSCLFLFHAVGVDGRAYSRPKTIYLFFAAFGGLFLQIAFLAAIKPMNGFSPRMEAILWLSFCLFWLMFLWEYAASEQMKRLQKMVSYRIKYPMILAFIFLMFLPGTNYFRLYQSIFDGQLRQYYSESEKRHDMLLCAEGDTLIVHPLKYRPCLLWVDDLQSDPAAWQNKAYEKFYGKPIFAKEEEHL